MVYVVQHERGCRMNEAVSHDCIPTLCFDPLTSWVNSVLLSSFEIGLTALRFSSMYLRSVVAEKVNNNNNNNNTCTKRSVGR